MALHVSTAFPQTSCGGPLAVWREGYPIEISGPMIDSDRQRARARAMTDLDKDRHLITRARRAPLRTDLGRSFSKRAVLEAMAAQTQRPTFPIGVDYPPPPCRRKICSRKRRESSSNGPSAPCRVHVERQQSQWLEMSQKKVRANTVRGPAK